MNLKYDCIVLAAGESNRMAGWKMLLPWGESTILEASLNHALQACGQIILVTGFKADEIVSRFQGRSKIRLVHNHEYSRGMFSSIQRGVAAVSTERFFVTHGDMPLILPEVFFRLAEAGSADVCRPVFKGKPGHPVLIHKKVIPAILNAPSSFTMAEVFSEFSMKKIETPFPGVVIDIDTPTDYRRAVRMLF
jgi:molybdenum cofactor cytidylyltransferase